MISLIVPVHNEMLYTSWCLASIQNRMTLPYELIIVNDQSDSKTTDFLKDYTANNKNAIYIETPQRAWHSLSCNIGIDNSKGDYICLLNSDTIISTGWEEKIIKFLDSSEGQNCSACGPSSSYAASPQTIPILNKKRYEIKYNDVERIAEDVAYRFKNEIMRAKVTGYCFIFTRDVLNRVGKLDHENLPSAGNETDWCIKAMIKHDLWPYIVRDAYVHHYGAASYNKALTPHIKNKAWSEADKILIKKWGRSNLDMIDKKLWKDLKVEY